MVYDKNKSGDPDFDDKVPPAEHGQVVTAGDGKVIGTNSPSTGPTTPEGAHLNVHVSPEDQDTRPAPGEVAEVKAEVQTYSAEDVPVDSISVDELKDAKPDAERVNVTSPAAKDADGNVKAEANRQNEDADKAEKADKPAAAAGGSDAKAARGQASGKVNRQ